MSDFVMPSGTKVVIQAPDITYAEARRQARSLLGQHADVEKLAIPLHPARVGVWVEAGTNQKKFVIVGSGASYVEALEDAKHRQR